MRLSYFMSSICLLMTIVVSSAHSDEITEDDPNAGRLRRGNPNTSRTRQKLKQHQTALNSSPRSRDIVSPDRRSPSNSPELNRKKVSHGDVALRTNEERTISELPEQKVMGRLYTYDPREGLFISRALPKFPKLGVSALLKASSSLTHSESFDEKIERGIDALDTLETSEDFDEKDEFVEISRAPRKASPRSRSIVSPDRRSPSNSPELNRKKVSHGDVALRTNEEETISELPEAGDMRRRYTHDPKEDLSTVFPLLTNDDKALFQREIRKIITKSDFSQKSNLDNDIISAEEQPVSSQSAASSSLTHSESFDEKIERGIDALDILETSEAFDEKELSL